MARTLKSDKVLFMAMLLLVCTSVVMVYSASAVVAMENNHDPHLFLFKQGTWALVGLLLVALVMRIDYRRYRQPILIWTGLAVVAMALVAVLFASRRNGAARWLLVGPLGIQPSELAKIIVILFMAALLERRMDRIDEPAYALLPIGIVLAVIVGLILAEPDLGTSASVVMVAAVMIFAAGIHYRYVFGLLLTSLPVLYVLVATSEYRRRRVLALSRSVGGSRRRVPADPVDHRRRHRRRSAAA